MNIKTLALYALIGHFFSAIFISMVIMKQTTLFRKRVQPKLLWFRKGLFLLALSVFVGNLVPIVIDLLTILNLITRSTNEINLVGVTYIASISLDFVLLAILLWVLYKIAGSTVLTAEDNES